MGDNEEKDNHDYVVSWLVSSNKSNLKGLVHHKHYRHCVSMYSQFKSLLNFKAGSLSTAYYYN